MSAARSSRESSRDVVESVAAGLGSVAGPGEVGCEVCGQARGVGPVTVGASCVLVCGLCAPVTSAALEFLEDVPVHRDSKGSS